MPRVAESVVVDYCDFCAGASQESRALGSCSFCGALACKRHVVQPTIIRQNLEPYRPPQVIVEQQGMAVLLPGSRGFCVFCGEQMEDQEKALHQCFVIRDVKHRMAEAEGKPQCPWCESADVAPITYGLPNGQGLEAHGRDRINLGRLLCQRARASVVLLELPREVGASP